MVRLTQLLVILVGATLCACSSPARPPAGPHPPDDPCGCASLPANTAEPVPAPERVFHVAQSVPGASDTNPGTPEQPWLTVQHAADVAQPGDEVVIAAGIYYEQVDLRRSGEPGRPIVFRGDGAAVIDGTGTSDEKLFNWGNADIDYVVLDGLEIRNGAGWGLWLRGNHNLIINCRIHDNGVDPAWPRASGILLAEGDHNRFIGNTVYRNTWNGINVENANYTEIAYNTVYENVNHMGINVFSNTSSWYGMMARNDIHHNVVYGNGESGIYTRYQMCNEISSNLVYGNALWGIFLHRGGIGSPYYYETCTLISNNTVTGNGSDGIMIAGARSVRILNNILSRNTSDPLVDGKAELRLEDLEGHQVDFNLYDPATASAVYVSIAGLYDLTFAQFTSVDQGRYERGGQQGAPSFLDQELRDYRLAAGSIAIDSGTDTDLRWSQDLQGTSRPQGNAFDQGAFEYRP